MAQDTTLNVQQLDGQALFARGNRRFKHERIPTGESRCCAWNNNQCSKARFKGNPIILELSYNIAKDKLGHGGVYVVTCPAGGYVVATGSFGQVKYETYDADQNRLSQSAH
ncbi:hypothetical protein INT45_013949 [Circinella minor]|uniref:Uncharacterized protein n=1 Tax=Circinella minor TaxID=1195481 RepID=A0A8H7S320_9FUNG|nr:hypothetical protein INT45_013949 [Circinella minor]